MGSQRVHPALIASSGMRRGSVSPAALSLLMAFMLVAPPGNAAETPPRDADARVELQISLCAPPEAIVRALDLARSGEPLEVWLFDDAALSLYNRGLRFRLRLKGTQSELTLKVADQDCATLLPGLVPGDEGKCEYDVHGDQVGGAVSLTRNLDADRTRRLLDGRDTLAQALSAAQIRYLREVVHAWPLPSGLRALGPVEVLRYRTRNKRYDVDVSRLPGGERYVEIARKVPRADMARQRTAMQTEIAGAGVAVCADQSAQAGNKLRAMLRPR